MYKRIRELREGNDKTQRELAQILNCSQQVYSNYELGQRDIPTEKERHAIACLFFFNEIRLSASEIASL